MQLILDSDNIDIHRNMSTIEQEPINEKFLTDKVIDHLTEDISTGNKENIQKQENIQDKGEDNVNDTDKEITSNRTDLLANNESEEKSNEDAIGTEKVQTVSEKTSEEITDDQSNENTSIENSEQIETDTINENVSNEESPSLEKEVTLDESNNVNIVETQNENDIKSVDKDPIANVIESVNDGKFIDTSAEISKEEESELDKEVDISELSSEINEEKEMDLDKEVDIADVSSELNKENGIDVDDAVSLVEEKELEKDSAQSEVPSISVHDKTQEADCVEVKSSLDNETTEKHDAIEIDDDDEKTCEQSAHALENVQNVDKNDETELIKDNEKPAQADFTAKKASDESAQTKRICRLSNNLDIFSDEEDEKPDEEPQKDVIPPETEKQCINIDDDDDIMLIDEDTTNVDEKKDTNPEASVEANTNDTNSVSKDVQSIPEDENQPKNETDISIESKPATEIVEEPSVTENKDTIVPVTETPKSPVTETNKMEVDKPEEPEKPKKPLLPKNFINTCKKNLSDMTRNDLEEFCILKIVESIVDRSNLGEIKAHLKNLTQTMEECKKKCLMLSKQNKDLQVVLKSVQEEQKSGSDVHITPLKITRSVGMQVMMVAEKTGARKKPVNGVGPQAPVPNNNTKPAKTQPTQPAQPTKSQKEKVPPNQQIPVPRLVPATPPAAKTNQTTTPNSATKPITNNAVPNGVRNSPPVQKAAEKRPRSQAVTVDLTDDEPPPKLQNVQRGPMNQQMRVLTAAPNMIPAQRFPPAVNSPRKVYIPISGPQAQNVRPGQTIMLKALSSLGPRPRAPTQALVAKAPAQSPVRYARGQASRHPAPLPDAMKQYQPPNWKALPPAPDLKLSKVENGIVISWKIDGYHEENHEEIASYQLYAYQETSSQPTTALWKKIGDVKALPLPMACTLTQFMAGFKYYFAVRAVDVRSRFGPFSLPGSILLLNKM